MLKTRKTLLKILLILLLFSALLFCAFQFIFFDMFFRNINETFVKSFDQQYMYTQLSSPKKTICTIVILKNENSENKSPYTLPYFNDRTIKNISWGLNTNDLFIYSSDIGLIIYRNIDGIWIPLNLIVKDNDDGTYEYFLYQSGSKVQNKLRYELSNDTIPSYIKTQIYTMKQKYGDDVFKNPDEYIN